MCLDPRPPRTRPMERRATPLARQGRRSPRSFCGRARRTRQTRPLFVSLRGMARCRRRPSRAAALEASVAAHRGFGFVTFVSDKGARYCIQQAGDPPMLLIDGSECTVRYAQQQNDHGAACTRCPRGATSITSASKRGGSGGIGGAGTSRDDCRGFLRRSHTSRRSRGCHDGPRKRRGADAPRSSAAAAAAADADGAECGGARKKQKKKEIVTVSRRQDAEPLDQRPITMREIFPKEFWRI